jgi:hypothetical protein
MIAEILKLENDVVSANSHVVCVLPYFLDENRSIVSIGVVPESEKMLKGYVKKNDSSILFRAKQTLEDQIGEIELLKESTRWKYLGNFIPIEDVNVKCFIFAVNMTGIETQKIQIAEVQELLDESKENRESVLISSFFLLFMQIYRQDLIEDGGNS